MKLVELEPHWLEYQGRRVGLMFRCPHCPPTPKRQWLSCFFEPAGSFPKTGDGYLDGYMNGDRALFGAALKATGDIEWRRTAEEVISCKHAIAWTRAGDDFASISITPSIDASRAGHWHGFVTNGAIT